MELAPKILFSRKEAAHLLSISERTLDYLIARGQLKVIRKGTRVMLHRSEMERWAKQDDPRPIRRPVKAIDSEGKQLRLG